MAPTSREAEIVALSKVDALTPEARKEQLARLKRASGRTPIALSAASGEGVEAALRAVFAVVEEARAQEVKDEAPAQESGWHP
jgi:GTP-binding protein